MLLCRMRLQSISAAASRTSRQLSSSLVNSATTESTEFRFGKLARQNKGNRQLDAKHKRQAPTVASLTAPASLSRPDQRPGSIDRFGCDGSDGFEFGALARTSGLIDDDPELARFDMDLSLEEAADAMSDQPDATPVLDEDDRPDHRPLARLGRKHDEAWYLRRIDKLAESGDTAGIVRLLHRDMIGEDRYLPTRRILHSVMRHLASVGAYEEAKAALNRCRSAGLEANYVTHCHYLRALSNASCFDGKPDRYAGELACRYYHALLEDATAQSESLHQYVYYFAVLACARNGMVQEALKIFDDSVNLAQLHPPPKMLDALLHAAYTDKINGSAIALLVWRRFRLAFGSRLDAYHYYRLIRCLRGCGIGQPSLMAAAEASAGPPVKAALPSCEQLGDGDGRILGDYKGAAAALRRLQDSWSAELNTQKAPKRLDSTGSSAVSEQLPWATPESASSYLQVPAQPSQPEPDFCLPAQPPVALALSCPVNLLRPRQPLPILPDSPDAFRLPWQRLTLVGGLAGLLESMQADRAKATPALALELMQLLPPIPEAEQTVWRFCRSRGFLRASMPGGGVVFYNALLRYRVRNRLEHADVLDELRSSGLRPDRDTYAALAGACCDQREAERLLADMARDSARPDQLVFYAMLTAAQPGDLAYRAWLVRRMAGFDVPPSPAIVRLLETYLARCRAALPKEASSPGSSAHSLSLASQSASVSPVDPTDYQLFRSAYESWLKANKLFQPINSIKSERLRLKHVRLKSLKMAN